MSDAPTIMFTWNGRKVRAYPGDTIAEALFRSGHRVTGSSRKRHRAMGYAGSFVQGVLVTIDGIPNLRLDHVAAKSGMRVTRQNFWPSPHLDLLGLFRFVPPTWVRGGFEHTRLMPSGTKRFLLWERLLAFLAGEGTLSAEPLAQSVTPGRKMSCDLVVIGGGSAGCHAANAAIATGRRVVLISRGTIPGRTALAMAAEIEAIHPDVTVLEAHEAFGIYRAGTLVAAAPVETGPAVAISCSEVVLAIGKRSCPPLVPGNLLPGVIDAAAALRLAMRPDMAPAFGRTVVVGSDQGGIVAKRLGAMGINVIATKPVKALRRILGKRQVEAVDFGDVLPCDTLVHAGPWITDPNLPFQMRSEGVLRLKDQPEASSSQIGFAAGPDESVTFDPAASLDADICPCMDVSAREITDLLQRGVTHVEELKRQTSCGMGPCQGFPCWEMLAAVCRQTLGPAYVADRPSHRAPRRALTIAQAAGLHDLVEPQK